MMKDINIVPITDASKPASAPKDSLPSTLVPVRDKATALLQSLVKELFSNADDTLFGMAERATSNTEQNDLFELMRDLRLKSAAIERRFLQNIYAGFAQLNQQPVTQPADRQAQSFESLSLVQDEALEESVAIDNMVAKVSRRDEQALQLLTARFNRLLDIDITAKDNPLNARVLAKSFVNSCESIEFPINVKLIILKLFEKHVLSELKTLYQATNQLLIDAGVLADLQTAPSTQKSPNRPAEQPAPSAESEPTATPAQATVGPQPKELEVALSELRDMLSKFRAATQPVQQAPANAVPISSNDLMHLLSHLQQRTPKQAIQDHDLRAQLNQLLAHISNKSQATRVVDQVDDDIINLVDMLFDFILDDRNLPDSLRALIARLQIPLLKVAIQDKAFFNSGNHPARLLLNEIASAALGLSSQKEQQRDNLYLLIKNTVQRAQTEYTDDPSIFNELLADFVSFTSYEQRRSALLEQRIRDAEEGRARAEQARLRVAQELNARLLGKTLPDVVVQLLQEVWSTVLILTFLRSGEKSSQWRNCLNAMDDLIWSAQVHDEPNAHLAHKLLLPPLLQQLHEGFSSAAIDPFVSNDFLNRLDTLHTEINLHYEQQAAAMAASMEASPMKHSSLAETTEPTEQEQTSVQRSMQQVREAIVLTQTDSAEQAPSESTLSDDDPALLTVDSLRTGNWIEFTQQDEHKLRCKLAAVSKPTGRYVFVNRSGMKVLEKSRMNLALEFKNNTATLLDNTLLFDRALESVIDSLRQLKKTD